MNLSREARAALRKGMTKGPWEAAGPTVYGDPQRAHREAVSTRPIASLLPTIECGGTCDELEANARAIALIPTMLDRIDELEAALRTIIQNAENVKANKEILEPEHRGVVVTAWDSAARVARQALKEIGND